MKAPLPREIGSETENAWVLQFENQRTAIHREATGTWEDTDGAVDFVVAVSAPAAR